MSWLDSLTPADRAFLRAERAARRDSKRSGGVRTVCGRPHRTLAAAKRGAAAARAWGWEEVVIEPRAQGAYFVVTGYHVPNYLVGGSTANTSAPGVLPRRYRWPSK